MNVLCLWLEESGFNYIIKRNNHTKVYKINFDMGRKWSLYFKTQMEIIFEHYKVKDAEVKTTETTQQF
jgi:hypothetical protein